MMQFVFGSQWGDEGKGKIVDFLAAQADYTVRFQGGYCGMYDHDHAESERDDSYYLNIAKERYAKGEIDKKQFEELKKDLIEK